VELDLDAQTLDSLKHRAKRQLRQRMQALRKAMPSASLSARSDAIVERLLGLREITQARRVALFWPMEGKGEVDLRRLDVACRERGAVVLYPFIRDLEGRSVGGFAAVASPADLMEGGHGFLEPPLEAPAAQPGELDVILVPALAVCERGQRLGYGSGFYDTILPEFRPPARAIVVAYDFQLLAELPSTDGDVASDIVVTDVRSFVLG